MTPQKATLDRMRTPFVIRTLSTSLSLQFQFFPSAVTLGIYFGGSHNPL
jgi:hypothetical protein